MQTVTIERLESLIVKVDYSNNGKTTTCILHLKNGFQVVGFSGVVDVTNFNQELGEKYAYENCINKLWELEGYRLQWQLFEQKEFEWLKNNG